MFFKKFELISNRTTIEFNQFDNIRFVVFGKFCFEETKRSHTKTKNEKQRKKLVNSLKKSFSISKYLETFFCFSIQTKTKRNKVFFQRGNKKRTVRSQKNETLTSLTLCTCTCYHRESTNPPLLTFLRLMMMSYCSVL